MGKLKEGMGNDDFVGVLNFFLHFFSFILSGATNFFTRQKYFVYNRVLTNQQ